jgi:type I restriction enzyme S subunit
MLINPWQEVELGRVVTLQRGYDLPYKARKQGSVPVVTSTGITDTHAEARERGPGVVTGRYGTIGEVFFVKEDYWPHNTTLFVKNFHGNDPLFISYLLQTIDFKTHSGKSGVPGVNRNDLHALTVNLPTSVEEQRVIAKALSDADGLLDGMDRIVAKKRDLKHAVMQQLLTGETRLPGFRDEWEEKSLFDLAERRKELFDDGDWIEAEFITDAGIRLVQTGNIGEGAFVDREARKYISAASFKKLRCKELRVGDVLICRLAEPAGRACILPEIGESRFITAVDVTIFRPPASLADRRFLVQLFCTRQWFQLVSERCGGSTRTRIARGQLGKIMLRLPAVDEQAAIADVFTDMDAEVAALERRREKTRALKRGMVQELLSGKTRLV